MICGDKCPCTRTCTWTPCSIIINQHAKDASPKPKRFLLPKYWWIRRPIVIHPAFSACSFGLCSSSIAVVSFHEYIACLVNALVSNWMLTITESLHLRIAWVRGAIRWLVLDHRPNPWDVVWCSTLTARCCVMRSAIISVLFHLYTCKWI